MLVLLKMEMLTSPSPCLVNDSISNPEDCIENTVDEWLEENVGGFRVWQLAAIVLSVLLGITIGLCCCIRFRIPRTKQEIEAYYVRKKITRHFRKELGKISDSDMEEMNLKKALERIQDAFEAEANKLRRTEMLNNEREGLHTGLNAVLRGMRVKFGKGKLHDVNI